MTTALDKFADELVATGIMMPAELDLWRASRAALESLAAQDDPYAGDALESVAAAAAGPGSTLQKLDKMIAAMSHAMHAYLAACGVSIN